MAIPSAPLPLIPTTVMGSHTRPAWYHIALETLREGKLGAADIEETLGQAVERAIYDQERLDIDVITDGEMRRLAGFISGPSGRIQGWRSVPSTERRYGPPSYDQMPALQVEGKLSAPDGLGVAQDIAFLRTQTTRRIKATCPGPLTLAGLARLAPPYADLWTLLTEVADLVNAELRACVAAGADYIQIDEPALGIVPGDVSQLVALVNHTVAGVDAPVALHICFGNHLLRPLSCERNYRHLFPALLEARVDQFMFEFANRNLSEIELWREYQPRQTLVMGVIDQKAHQVESPELVAERIRTALEYVPAERLWVSPDCGIRNTPYAVGIGKLRAMVAGARLVRAEMAGAAT